MRTAEYLNALHIPHDELPHAPAFCASRRARWLRASGREVAKSVLLIGPDGPVLAVLRSTHEIDLTALGEYWGGELRLARQDESADIFHDCEWGSVPAFGNLYNLLTILDGGIDRDDYIVFEYGSHFVAVRMQCADYERLTGAIRLNFTRSR